jgi:hypothetical protein
MDGEVTASDYSRGVRREPFYNVGQGHEPEKSDDRRLDPDDLRDPDLRVRRVFRDRILGGGAGRRMGLRRIGLDRRIGLGQLGQRQFQLRRLG